jgi:hypothetical protein
MFDDESRQSVIRPVLMQRQCDGGKGDMSAEEWAKRVAARLEHGTPIQGCGTWFQWYWGMNCVCPNCGITWCVVLEDIKRYGVVDQQRPFDERNLVERVVREVLVRLGSRY